MQPITLTNVRQRGNDQVYRLVFATEGLSLLHTTNTDGVNDYTGGSIEYRAEGEENNEILDSLIAGTEPLSDDVTQDVLENVNSRHFAWGQIQKLTLNSDEPRTLHVRANNNDYAFEFPYTPPEQVDAFAAKVRERLELEQAGQREMRR